MKNLVLHTAVASCAHDVTVPNSARQAHDTLLEALSHVLPSGAAVSLVAIDAATGKIFPEEIALVATAVGRRRAEFSAGRICARRALTKIGFAPVSILQGAGGEPLWPHRVVGSITHDDGWCAAVVHRADQLDAIGVDLARIVPLTNDVVRLFCSTRELDHLAALPTAERAAAAAARFSLKEAVLKCLQPALGNPIDVRDLEIDMHGCLPRVDLPSACRTLDDGWRVVSCRYRIHDGWVVSGAWIPRRSSAKLRNSLFE